MDDDIIVLHTWSDRDDIKTHHLLGQVSISCLALHPVEPVQVARIYPAVHLPGNGKITQVSP